MRKKFPRYNISPLLFIGLFALIGIVLLLSTRAVTPTASIESEQGTSTNNVISFLDSSASGGRGIQFAQATPPPPSPPPPTGNRDPFLWPFTSNSPWNMPIGSGAQYSAASDPITLNLLDTAATAWINAGEYSHPMFKASASDPLVNVNYIYASNLPDCCGGTVSYKIPANVTPAAGADRHLHILDPNGQTLHEVFDMQPITPGANPRSAFKYAPINLRGTGFAPTGGGNQGSRAYGGSAVGGLIRTWEVEAGAINHALALTLRNLQLKSPFVWPATSEDTGGSTEYAGLVPMGSLVAIPPSVDLNSLGLSARGMILGKALQNYGAYVSDRGGAFALYAEPSAEQYMAAMRTDFPKLRTYLRIVTNNTPSTVGGGGTPRAPLAPPL